MTAGEGDAVLHRSTTYAKYCNGIGDGVLMLSGVVGPFMEWVTRMDMDMEWISGGYGYYFVKSFGVEWIMG